MTVAVESLDLDRVRVVYPGDKTWPIRDCIRVCLIHNELEVAGNLAYHTYVYTWRVTPRASGEAKVSSGKGLHILRCQADGSWRIAREIWNAMPDSVRS